MLECVSKVISRRNYASQSSEIQLGELQIRFNESPDAEQLKVALAAFTDANKPVC